MTRPAYGATQLRHRETGRWHPALVVGDEVLPTLTYDFATAEEAAARADELALELRAWLRRHGFLEDDA